MFAQSARPPTPRVRRTGAHDRRAVPRVSPWNNDELVREELFSIERLEQHAVSLAVAQQVSPTPVRRPPLSARLSDNESVLLSAYRTIAKAVGEGRAITPAAEWLLDNYHLVEAQIREVREDLPPGYYRQLPKLSSGPFAGYPRVFGIAWAFVAHADSHFDPENLRRFVRAYQTVQPLTIGELWAVAITLRIVLVENLRRAADRIVSSRAAREAADEIADRLLGVNGHAAQPNALIERYDQDAMRPGAFVVQLVQRLRDQDPKIIPALTWLEQKLEAQGTTAETIVHDEHQRQGGSNVTVRNVITSMRLISELEWSEFFESVSLIDEVLRAGSDFSQMDFATRNLYRSRIEELSRHSGETELAIAHAAMSTARRGSERQRDPGYHLIAAGRPAFEIAVGYRAPLSQRPARWAVKHGAAPYIGAIFIVTAAVLATALYAVDSQTLWHWKWALLAFLGLIPALDLAIALVNRAVTRGFSANVLPGLALREGVPPQLRTLVAVPTLLTAADAIEEALERLEIHYLASPEGDLHFALLTDWADAATERLATDGALFEIAAAGIARLNRLHGLATAGERFLLLHRRRTWSETQQQWMGWERKRGKLRELNRLLRGASDTTFVDADGHAPVVPPDVRYVITLDADTRLPRETARRLIGKMAHPLNRPRFDATSGRVVEGYAVLQPRVTPSLPVGREGSLFQRIVSSAPGLDPYASAVSDVYQDLFGEGSYAGKGIYDVDAFETALVDRAAEGTLLSHDLFEGIFARAGLVSDVEVVEEFPARYDIAAARQHRWARGDWQLLPWILGRRARTVPLLGSWKMLDNLRRTLSAPTAVIALAAGWTLPLHAALLWTAFILTTLAVPTLLPVFAAIVPRRAGITARSHFRALRQDVTLAVRQMAFQIVFLAHQASLMIDAIGRTLFRLFVSRRNLMEWITAAQASLSARLDLAGFHRRLFGAVVIALGVTAAIYLSDGAALWVAAPFVALWLASPAIALWISRAPRAASGFVLSAADAEALQQIARRTWRYFETFVTPADNMLPPDNFQEDPQPVLAHRTSPTNIGLYLLATVSARDFKWIDTPECIARLEATLATMERLQRFRGHFYNWYDTRDLRPLEPRYVSTVDSGNLAAHLIAVANAAREWIDADDGVAARLRAIAATARTLANAMEFGFLLDPQRKLLSIGYRSADGTLDPSCYDLLASEARLASFFAIAKADVASRHWFRLGRPVTAIANGAALISWSGSMFEYLMPSLVMRAPAGSLLAQTNRLIVRRQRDYGAEHQVPWGVSESAYHARDLELTYQYSNFGVPGLGLKRGLSENIVIAPYATALAAMVDPQEAVRNFKQLTALEALGDYGFYEALDYTRTRLPEGASFATVRAFMAHHQGMTIVAIANVLLNGLMRQRFHAEPAIRATELLLQERTPRDVSVAHPRAEEVHTAAHIDDLPLPEVRRLHTAHTATPQAHLLSNGRYAVMVTASGSGYSRWGNLGVTRWREDTTCDDTGSYLYLRDSESGVVWSAGYQPRGAEPDRYEVTFSENRAEFRRTDEEIDTLLAIVVSPEDDAEVRHLSLTNTGDVERDIEVTSYAELMLAPPAADTAHPAFSKLFVNTEHIPSVDALLATRRKRSPDEPDIWAAHQAVVEAQVLDSFEFETDRAQFLGRGRDARNPLSVMDGRRLSNTAGAVLDPIFALRYRVRVAPGATARLAFWTVVASSRQQVLDLLDKHRDPSAFGRAGTLAWTQAQVQLRHLDITTAEAGLFQKLAGHVLFADASLRPSSDTIRRGAGQPALLWSQSISGDRPIVLLRIDAVEDLGLVRQLLQAHEYWRLKQLAVDLVILNERTISYVQDLQTALETAVRMSQARAPLAAHGTHGAVFIVRADAIPAETRALLASVARVVLAGRRGSLAEQLNRQRAPAPIPVRRSFREASRAGSKVTDAASRELEFFNGLGGFDAGGKEYVTLLGPGQTTPMPWINVIANPVFGFQVAAEGSGFTWTINSRENQLTPWSNDPVADRAGEALYLRDEETGDLWSATAAPIHDRHAFYCARHGQGYSRFEHESRGIGLDLLMYVPLDDPIRISRLKIRNTSARTRRLSITAYVEWVLGTSRAACAPSIVTEIDAATGALFARNPWNSTFGSRVALADLAGRQTDLTADRREFLGRHGTLAAPAALLEGSELSRRTGAGLDPCGALQTFVHLKAGESAEVVFFLGEAADTASARELIRRYRTTDLEAVFQSVLAHWDDVLGRVQVKTPDRSLDILLNRWALYQTLVCRIWARSGFYQASGAYGFRDQLQDAMALAISRPNLTREHLLRAAGRQFPAGDVQHWWLPPTGQGVRTRISDDRVWLAYTAAHYVDATGDLAILNESVPFIEGQTLQAGEHDAYFLPSLSDERASLFEHCARALDQCLAVGAHGLPLIGTGDWNDGMNRVGELGRGESVWLGWFLYATLKTFAPLALARGESTRSAVWLSHANALQMALERDGWDGKWYRRGFFDDGTPFGSASSEECRIDSIAQSWSVISGAADPARAVRAMAAVDSQLIQRDNALALLFAPPFDRTALDPGYVKGYPPGIRENGGQYTHAATWSVMAFALLGQADKAAELFALLNPINRTTTRATVQRYKVEPYAVAADIYSVAPHIGRGGWTWYTGSAGWMYRVGLESILGFRLHGNSLSLTPCIPAHWPGFEIVFKHGSSRYDIKIENPPDGAGYAELDGERLPEGATRIPLADDGKTHRLRIVIAQGRP